MGERPETLYECWGCGGDTPQSEAHFEKETGMVWCSSECYRQHGRVALRRELTRLREVVESLREYAQHRRDCECLRIDPRLCDCGLSQVLKALPAPPAPVPAEGYELSAIRDALGVSLHANTEETLARISELGRVENAFVFLIEKLRQGASEEEAMQQASRLTKPIEVPAEGSPAPECGHLFIGPGVEPPRDPPPMTEEEIATMRAELQKQCDHHFEPQQAGNEAGYREVCSKCGEAAEEGQ